MDFLKQQLSTGFFSTTLRKIYYNLTVTGLSIVVELFIGTLEIIQLITQALGIHSEILFYIANLILMSQDIYL